MKIYMDNRINHVSPKDAYKELRWLTTLEDMDEME